MIAPAALEVDQFESSPYDGVSLASAGHLMLHCTMTSHLSLQLGLDDLLADLRHARRQNDLGRLALLSYCEVRRWAREAGNQVLAEHASELITASPHVSRQAFLGHIDDLIVELEQTPRLVEMPISGRSPSNIEPGVRITRL